LLACDEPAASIEMSLVSTLKGLGYLVSTLSVILLGIVAWKSASEQPLLFLCLILGMLASILGMGLRWTSHRLEQKKKDAGESLASPERATAAAVARGAKA
jgi:hypothetical protein